MVPGSTVIHVNERLGHVPKLEKLDHPLVFLLTISLGVAAVWAFISWGLASLGWTGPLGLFKGGAQ